MTIEDYIAFLARVPILRRLGASALRILETNPLYLNVSGISEINAAPPLLCLEIPVFMA